MRAWRPSSVLPRNIVFARTHINTSPQVSSPRFVKDVRLSPFFRFYIQDEQCHRVMIMQLSSPMLACRPHRERYLFFIRQPHPATYPRNRHVIQCNPISGVSSPYAKRNLFSFGQYRVHISGSRPLNQNMIHFGSVLSPVK